MERWVIEIEIDGKWLPVTTIEDRTRDEMLDMLAAYRRRDFADYRLMVYRDV